MRGIMASKGESPTSGSVELSPLHRAFFESLKNATRMGGYTYCPELEVVNEQKRKLLTRSIPKALKQEYRGPEYNDVIVDRKKLEQYKSARQEYIKCLLIFHRLCLIGQPVLSRIDLEQGLAASHQLKRGSMGAKAFGETDISNAIARWQHLITTAILPENRAWFSWLDQNARINIMKSLSTVGVTVDDNMSDNSFFIKFLNPIADFLNPDYCLPRCYLQKFLNDKFYWHDNVKGIAWIFKGFPANIKNLQLVDIWSGKNLLQTLQSKIPKAKTDSASPAKPKKSNRSKKTEDFYTIIRESESLIDIAYYICAEYGTKYDDVMVVQESSPIDKFGSSPPPHGEVSRGDFISARSVPMGDFDGHRGGLMKMPKQQSPLTPSGSPPPRVSRSCPMPGKTASIPIPGASSAREGAHPNTEKQWKRFLKEDIMGPSQSPCLSRSPGAHARKKPGAFFQAFKPGTPDCRGKVTIPPGRVPARRSTHGLRSVSPLQRGLKKRGAPVSRTPGSARLMGAPSGVDTGSQSASTEDNTGDMFSFSPPR